MPTELAKAYDPQEAQKKWLALWQERGYFHSRPDQARKPYTIVIPPPNVTGALHMGHALNNTLQDVLIRWRRMQGFNAEWMPGTDHAGIATQAVVERLIYQQEKKTRRELGREELVKRIWEWKDKYEARILGQLRQLGCSCDWDRTRFTLDDICARAVRQTFFNMFKDGLIFRGKRLVNWDAQLQTSVADDETYTEDTKGFFWTFKYPVKDTNEFIRFATTRPETMLGDTAVCVHPSDERYKHLIGKMVTIPLVNRDIPIIADGLLADPSLGTGCVKVTPAHDPNDYACYQRHPEIGIINILNPDGTLNDSAGKYQGLDRYKARDAVVADMEALGLYEGKEERVIPLKFSDRSKTPIEPYLSDQWFVKMGEAPSAACGFAHAANDQDHGSSSASAKPQAARAGFAQMAMDAVTNGSVTFFPERYANSYLDWLAEKRDWCISRQLWWGHRIPVWTATLNIGGVIDDKYWEKERRLRESAIQEIDEYLSECGIHPDEYSRRIDDIGTFWICTGTVRVDQALNALVEFLESEVFEKVEPGKPIKQALRKVPGFEQATSAAIRVQSILFLRQDPDVLDTWFSSMLWPHSTFGWPEQTPELRYYYPTSVLVTSRDIITLWVARMVIAGLYNLNQVPFHHVYITVKLLDGFGETMSKSKGNGVDPLDIIDRYGADALRFLIVQMSSETQDARLPVANVCPHCDTLVPVKQEHMYMRTRKVTCPHCKKPFRPGGPWPTEDAELKTAKQASDRFEIGRNFANKIWNAARFLLLNLEGYSPQALHVEELPIEDRWILSRLAATTQTVTESLEGYHFSDVARTLYEFVWSEFCDWYLEMAKGRLQAGGDSAGDERTLNVNGRATTQRVLVGVLDGILRLVHPVMPFVAESIWQALNEAAFERGLPAPEPATESVVIAPWPEYPAAWKDAGVEERIGKMQELVRFVREVRNRYSLDPKNALELFVRCPETTAADFRALGQFIALLAGVRKLEAGPETAKPPQAAGHVTPAFEAYVSLQGLIDVAAELKRLDKQIAEKKKFLQGIEAKLANANFVQSAPAEVVQQQRDKAAETKQQIAALEANRKVLAT
ncbi:MAG: valine--tRNA ligase [Gemmataceae bacterium]|nr:valine--tRNA ligase [Gemmataceae bacterium]MCI0742373.1 valine--tRNA ligase [Gemmataceae bacterium]